MTIGDHPVPLAPQWLGVDGGPYRAGAETVLRVRLRNAGGATWRSRGEEGLQLAYHWLDPLGNPVVWDGTRTAFPRGVAAGEALELDARVRAPRPPGRYTLRFDVVEEHRFWLAELGCDVLDVDVEVLPRITSRRLAVVVHGEPDRETADALGRQEEALVDDEPAAVAHLVGGAVPPPGWSRTLLDAHAEGWAAVGTAVAPAGGFLERQRAGRRLAAWAPGGRNPRLGAPILLPSLLTGLEPGEHLGLPSFEGADALFDGRVAIRLRPRSGRRPT